MKWLCAGLALAIGGWLWIGSRGAPLAEGALLRGEQGESANQFQWQGAASCAAAACHGEHGAKGSKRSEYSTWIDHDAHARARGVLFNDQSRRIAGNLHLGESAHESGQCLPCHAPSPPAARGARFQLSDGVSCETCHGPAEKWLADHYLPAWKSKSDAERRALGFLPTKNLLERARGCVACHVGHDDVDVNHDLIAAGHPPLQFEYSSYLAAVPRHWDLRDEKVRYADLEVRAWLIGQHVTTGAALELLAHRATKDKGAAWPELAEFDCRSCHHDLTGRLPASGGKLREDSASLLRWNDWHSSFFGHGFSVPVGNGDEDKSLSTISFVQLELQKPRPDADRVASTARRVARSLGESAARIDRNKGLALDTLRGLFDSLAKDELAARDWPDAARQRYLGLRAVYETMADRAPGQLDPRWKSTLDKLRKELEENAESSYWRQARPRTLRDR